MQLLLEDELWRILTDLLIIFCSCNWASAVLGVMSKLYVVTTSSYVIEYFIWPNEQHGTRSVPPYNREGGPVTKKAVLVVIPNVT